MSWLGPRNGVTNTRITENTGSLDEGEATRRIGHTWERPQCIRRDPPPLSGKLVISVCVRRSLLATYSLDRESIRRERHGPCEHDRRQHAAEEPVEFHGHCPQRTYFRNG